MVGDDDSGNVSTAEIGVAARIESAAALILPVAILLVALVEGDDDRAVINGTPDARLHDPIHQMADDAITARNELFDITLGAIRRYRAAGIAAMHVVALI